MDLNHIHLGSKNVGNSMEFYQTFFNFKKKFDHGEGVFIENDEGFLIAIDPVKEVPVLPSWFHLGFCLNDRAKVREIYDQMTNAGIKFAKEYADYGDDASAFFCFDPDGYKIEVSWHRD